MKGRVSHVLTGEREGKGHMGREGFLDSILNRSELDMRGRVSTQFGGRIHRIHHYSQSYVVTQAVLIRPGR